MLHSAVRNEGELFAVDELKTENWENRKLNRRHMNLEKQKTTELDEKATTILLLSGICTW